MVLRQLKEIILRFGPAIIWMGLIFTVSSFSTLPGPKVYFWDYVLKKSAHMLEYGILFYLWQRALNYKREDARHYLIAFLITVLYAASDEFHQSFTPNRHPSIVDVGYDSLGAFISYIRLKGFI